MAICTKCGNQIPEGARFCDNCGAPQMSAGRERNSRNSQESMYAGSMDAAFEQAYQETVSVKDRKKKTGLVGIIIAVAVAVLLAAVAFLKLSGWSTEDAEEATQAFLDFYFKEDTEKYPEYQKDVTEEDLSQQIERWREESIAHQFKSDVPVTDELKTRYADFYIDLEKKAHYTVGEAEKTEDGFEVPILVEPITSLDQGGFVLLDLQLNEDLSQADLNERVYARELELMKKLTEDPVYGEPEEFTLRITKGEDGYSFSEDDLNSIHKSLFIRDKHWSKDRAKEAAEALLGGIYGEKYAELAEISVATEEEIRDVFGNVFSPKDEKETLEARVGEEMRENGLNESYSMSDDVAEGVSKADRDLLHGTKYEVMDIEGDESEYIARIKLTPYDLEEALETAGERIQKEMDSFSDFGQYMDRFYELVTEEAERIISSDSYADPIEYKLHLKFNSNDSYEPDYDEISLLFTLYGEGGEKIREASEKENDEDAAEGESEDENDKNAAEGESEEENDKNTAEGEHEDDAVEKTEEREEESDAVKKDNTDSDETVTYSDGDEIPVYVGDLKIEFRKTTLQDVMDETGMELQSDYQGNVVNKNGLDFVYLDMDSDMADFSVDLENKDSGKIMKVEDCNVYGLDYMVFSRESSDYNKLLSVGNIRIGDTLDKVKKTFGEPEYEDKETEYVDYLLSNYSMTFMYDEDGIVWSIRIEVEDL